MNFINVRQNVNVAADGVHDDTRALQACIDRMKHGGTVWFPDGIYRISAALIFYSHQHLRFSDGAVILRDDTSDPVTRYLLASYSEPSQSGYGGTHDAVISGGVFDGNGSLSEKATLINTVHCRNITIRNCRFVHGARWHYIELNATENAVVCGCVFDGSSYTDIPDNLLNEQVQLDLSHDGSYGPVYDCRGTLIDFCKDDTPCRNIVIENNLFKCAGFPAVGHHGDCAHENILIRGNVFDGPSGRGGFSRGYVIFRPKVRGITVQGNAFLAPGTADNSNIGVIVENTDADALTMTDNCFQGLFAEHVRHVTEIGDKP